ncbi:glycosyltransferase family 58 protein [Thelephora ganbajun]|uniref:Glycosyltransferase family 58 protein n=1 Tax=Thelephora ganbajun TaxID=370292 RepID=A0ACB6ZNW9_THEGA|nr:glycosyltransferase family 58 protein [Thelephora ganbajun]
MPTTAVRRLQRLGQKLLFDSSYYWYTALLVLLGDTLLIQLVIHFVRYTEIDWETYMHQIEVYLRGERNYSLIDGPTGALVYPAGHVYIHRFLYAITDSGRNIRLAQHIYGGIYLVSVVLMSVIYRKAAAPNWLLLSLPLSKRLHSIYSLRLFNDCWAVVSVQASILAYCSGFLEIGTILYAGALSVKMSNMLYLPGIMVVTCKKRGLLATIGHVATIVALQGLIGFPFLREYPWEYLAGAFDFSRVFLYKWTVNWRFVPEEIFLSKPFAKGLLAIHLVILVTFLLNSWFVDLRGSFATIIKAIKYPTNPPIALPVTSDSVVVILFTCNIVGMTCARSLHYQFYSWYAQQLPLLTWKSLLEPRQTSGTLVLAAVEYSWNVFPSTNTSSLILLIVNSSLILLIFLSGSGKSRAIQTKVQKLS